MLTDDDWQPLRAAVSSFTERWRAFVEQPWYGFGGAWGRVGKVRDATGPLGPGPHWKHAAPRPSL